MIAEQDGSNQRRIEIAEPSFHFRPEWSPDGTRLAFTNTHYQVLVLDLESGDVQHIGHRPFRAPRSAR